MNKYYLVLYNKEKKFYFTKYFSDSFSMDTFLKKLWFIKNLVLIEDSRDIKFF